MKTYMYSNNNNIIIIFIIIMTNFFRRVFSECEVITTSLMTLETILPEECAFVTGFSCTVCTNS